MNKTIVVNIYKEPYDDYIGRPGKGKDGYFRKKEGIRPKPSYNTL